MIIDGTELPDSVDVLGVEYKVCYDDENEPKIKDADGYCELWAKEIHVDRSLFEKRDDPFVLKNLKAQGKKVIRHEMVHAFIQESGLWECCEWARNEECTDWIARQFPKLLNAFKKAGVIE